MNKIYFLYLLSVSISLIFLTVYFSFIFPKYTLGIFYIVSMILISSIVLIQILDKISIPFSMKLLTISFLSLIIFFGLKITSTVFFLTPFGTYISELFSSFFLISSLCFILFTSLSINQLYLFKNKYFLFLLFSPLIIFSLWVLINYNLTGIVLFNGINFKLFIIATSSFYSLFAFYNFLRSNFFIFPFREKYLIFNIGIFLMFFFSGICAVDVFPQILAVFIFLGSFLISLSLIIQSNLSLYNKMFNFFIKNLKGKKRNEFLIFLRKESKKYKKLKIIISNFKIVILDNPNLSNKIEKNMYNKLILKSYKWFRKDGKKHNKKLKDLKKFYNNQVIESMRMTKILF